MKTAQALAIEALIKIATESPLAGGKAEEEPEKLEGVDPGEIAEGKKVEMEHTRKPEVAKEIAEDHIAEIPDYYPRLEKMEDEAKEEMGEEAEGGTVPSRTDVISFLQSQFTAPDDDAYHAWAESRGYDKHKAEAVAYSLAKELADMQREKEVTASSYIDILQKLSADKKKEEDKLDKLDSKIAPVPEKDSKKEAADIADRVLRKLSADSMGGSSAGSSSISGSSFGGSTSKATAVPSMGKIPPAPGQMGAAQPKRLDPLQKQN